MKILITGGAGLIGSHCAEHFANKKCKIVVVDNLLRSQIFKSTKKSVEYNWNYLKGIKNVKLIKQDVCNYPQLLRIFKNEKPDCVIHTAGQPGVRASLENPHFDYFINSTGTLNTLEALRKTNKKASFIYCSTNKVFGHRINSVPIKELKKRYSFKSLKGIDENFGVDLTGHTPYGVSKLSGDLYSQEFSSVYGLKCAVFRMSCIYGTRQFGFEDQGWLAWFSIRFMQGKPISIYGDGKQVRDVLWVGDLIKAYESFIYNKSPLTENVFNMGGGEENTLSLIELIEILEDISGKKIPVKYCPWRAFDQKVYVSDIRRVKRILKWKPSVTPHEGVKKLYEWVKENPQLFR